MAQKATAAPGNLLLSPQDHTLIGEQVVPFVRRRVSRADADLQGEVTRFHSADDAPRVQHLMGI